MPRINPLVLTFALIWIITKIVFFYAGDSDTGFTVGMLTNLLFILSICALSLWKRYRRNRPSETHFLDDLRLAVKQGAVYVVIVTGFTAVYHTVLDTDLTERRIQKRLVIQQDHIDSYPSYEAFLADQEGVDPSLTREALMDQQEAKARKILNPLVSTAFSLLSLLIWVVVSSICSTALMRGVIFK